MSYIHTHTHKTCLPDAELQSMFLDSLVGDAAWRGRYACSKSVDHDTWSKPQLCGGYKLWTP